MLDKLIALMITSFLFFPSHEIWRTPEDFGLRHKDVDLMTQDGVKLHGWFLPAERGTLALLYLHGNAGNVADRLEKAQGWLKRGVSVLLFDYRGFGKSEGKISQEKDLLEDANAGLAWLRQRGIPDGNILVYGESVGSSPALDLGAAAPVKGVIVEGAFTSLPDMARLHYFPVPDFFFKNFMFDNRAKIRNLKVPVFILHAGEDEICPVKMGRELYELATVRKEFYAIPNARHNDSYSGTFAEMFDKPMEFFTPKSSPDTPPPSGAY